MTAQPCPVCGCSFVPKRVSRGGLTRSCSKRCGQRLRAREAGILRVRACEICGTEFRPKGGVKPGENPQSACSRKCGAIVQARRRGRLDPVERYPSCLAYFPTCRCGRVIAARRKNQRLCSAQCRIDDTGLRVTDLYGLALSLGLGGAHWLRLLTRYLAERDGTDCAICRDPIRMDLPSGPKGDPSGLGPSVDHLLPRSQGGGDDPANLRLAHWLCNRNRKAARREHVQLVLVG